MKALIFTAKPVSIVVEKKEFYQVEQDGQEYFDMESKKARESFSVFVYSIMFIGVMILVVFIYRKNTRYYRRLAESNKNK